MALGPVDQSSAAVAEPVLQNIQTPVEPKEPPPPPAQPPEVEKAEGEKKDTQVNIEDLEKAVAQLQGVSSILNRKLNFEVDNSSDQVVVRVIDTETNEVVRQIPSEQVLRIAAQIEAAIGVMFDEMA